MLKKYNISAELFVLAGHYFKKGQKRDALRLAMAAMEEKDSEKLLEALDKENEALDPTSEEVKSDSEMIEEVVEEAEAEDEELPEVEEVEEVEEAEAEDEELPEVEDEELPEVEEVLSKVRARKRILSNLASLRRYRK